MAFTLGALFAAVMLWGSARCVAEVDPFVQQGGALIAGEETLFGRWGTDVALSRDGDTALVSGSSYQRGTGAWVFTRSGAAWSAQEIILPPGILLPPEEGKEPGYPPTVSLTADGNTALLAGDDAWIYERLGSRWSQVTELPVPLGSELNPERSMAGALSANGEAAVVGVPEADAGSGAAWVFTRSGSKWKQGPKLTGIGEVGAGGFGSSLRISADGTTIVVGAPKDDGEIGAAFVFARAGEGWVQQGDKLTGPGEIGAGDFGSSVALSADGSSTLIGGPSDSQGRGAIWTFARSASVWAQSGSKLTGPAPTVQAAFGDSVALSDNGQLALVGAPLDLGSRGATSVLRRSGSTWIEWGSRLTESVPGLDGGARFGVSVALSGEGNTVLVGAQFAALNREESGELNWGAAFVFTHPLPLVTTGAASAVTQRTATLGATVNPGGGAIGECWVEYGPTTSYGSTAPCLQDPGSDTNPVAVSASAGALAANRAYHYRAFARNPAGAGYGDDATFTTLPDPPTVTTEPPSSVGPGYATLSASVNPNGARVTSCRFEYGASSGYGASLPCSPQALEGESPLAVSATAPVDADAGYHFRIVASNSGGGSYGADQTFTTPKPPTPPLPQLQSTMTWLFGWSKQYTKVRSLVVHNLPLGAHVEVACTGRGCPVGRSHSATLARRKRCHKRKCAKVKHRLAQGPTVDLTSLFTGRRLSVGAQISVSVTKPGWNGKSFRFTTRPSRIPTIQIACLAPGSRRPGVGC